MQRFAFLMIIIGAILWGTIGIFVQALYDLGFTPIEVVTLRVTFAFLFIFLYAIVKERKSLQIKWQHIYYFLGTGIFSIVFFNWAYFTAIQEMNLSIAAVLLYTGPAFVTIMSRIFFKEPMTAAKMIALALTFIGCVLVIGLFPLNLEKFSLYGLLMGIGSGFGYALYSIFGKVALKKYSSMTITIYTFFIAALALVPTTGMLPNIAEWFSLEVLLIAGGLGIFPTVFAYLLYTKGLQHVESSKAAIAATIEPVVAALIGIFVFKDILSFWQMVGIAVIVFAVLLINVKSREGKVSETASRQRDSS